MKAVIQVGGQQYIVQKGDEIVVDHLVDADKTVSFDPLLVFDDSITHVGAPTVTGASVTADVVEAEMKGEKVQIMKFQSKKRVKKLTGHRQLQTKLSIKSVSVK